MTARQHLQGKALAMERLAHAQSAFYAAERALVAAVARAHEAGNSLRTIGSATGIPATAIQGMLSPERTARADTAPRRLSMDDENSIRAVDLDAAHRDETERA